jgi:CRP-like cAMP-binding protein
METREYKQGETIMHQGDASDYVYRITSGEVEVFLETAGRRVVLGRVKQGELLGEMGVLDGQPRSASAESRCKVQAEVLERWEFFKMVSEDSNASFRLISRLSDRLRVVNLKLAEASGAEDAGTPRGNPVEQVTTTSLTAASVQQALEGQRKLKLTAGTRELGDQLPSDSFELFDLPYSVGRQPVQGEPSASVPIDLCLTDTPPFALSRQHFSIAKRDDQYVVLDLGSTLGTSVNGEYLGHQFGQDWAALKDGDNRIVAGGQDSPFRFELRLEKL